MINFSDYLFVTQGTQIYSVHLVTHEVKLIATLPSLIYGMDCDYQNNKIYAVVNPSVAVSNPSFDIYQIDQKPTVKKLASKFNTAWKGISFDNTTQRLFIPVDNRNRIIFNYSPNSQLGKDDVMIFNPATSSTSFVLHSEFYDPSDIFFDGTNGPIYILNSRSKITNDLFVPPNVVVLDRFNYDYKYSIRLDFSIKAPTSLGVYKNKLIVGGYNNTLTSSQYPGKILIIDAINYTILASFDVSFIPTKIVIQDNLAYVYTTNIRSNQTGSTLIDLDSNLESTYFVYRYGATDAVINNVTKEIFLVRYDDTKKQNLIYKNNREIASLPRSSMYLFSILSISPFAIPTQTPTTTTSLPSFNCSPIRRPYNGLKNYNNELVTVTESLTGSVGIYNTSYISCNDIQTPANSIYLGQSGSFSYTLNFNKSINNLVIILTATGNSEDENFIISTNAGIPSIIPIKSCYTSIVNNQIISGKSAPHGVGGGGGLFIINAPNNFSSLTISGNGGAAGSILALCSSLAKLSPQTTTTTTTTTSTTTAPPDSSYFIIKNSKLYIDSKVLNFNMPNRTYSVKVNLVNPDNNNIIQTTQFNVYVDPCECVDSTTSTTTTICPIIYVPAVMCDNGYSLSDFPIFDNNGCIIGYSCPPTNTTTTTTQTPVYTTGLLYTYGFNKYGALGSGNTLYTQRELNKVGYDIGVGWKPEYSVTNPTKVSNTIFKNIYAPINGDFILAADTDGKLYGAGRNDTYVFGDSTVNQRKNISPINNGFNWMKVVGGTDHVLGITTSGELYAWGSLNNYAPVGWLSSEGHEGKIGDGTSLPRSTPTKISQSNNWIDIAAGSTHSLALNNIGEIYGWGSNYFGQISRGSSQATVSTPIKVAGGDKPFFTKIYAGHFTSFALDTVGNLWACGYGQNGELGLGSPNNFSSKMVTFKKVDFRQNITIKKVAASFSCTLVLTTNNELYTAGLYSNFTWPPQVDYTRFNKINKMNNADWIDISAGGPVGGGMAINSSGEIYLFAGGVSMTKLPSGLVPLQIYRSADHYGVLCAQS